MVAKPYSCVDTISVKKALQLIIREINLLPRRGQYFRIAAVGPPSPKVGKPFCNRFVRTA